MTDFITLSEAAKQLKISKVWLQKLAQAGRIGQKIGGRYLITAEDLAVFAKIPRKVGNPNFKKGQKK